MKKLAKSIVTVGCAALLAFGVAGCNEAESAYDIAVKNGFSGTETEWLLSLHGENGANGKDLTAETLYETAKANGYTGTFLEFCAALNISLPTVNDTAKIAENTLSVVSVYCGYSVTTSANAGWFGGISQKTDYGSQAGSGVIVDLNKEAGTAYIITNYHVVYNKNSDQKGVLKDNIWVYPYGAYNDFNSKDGDVRGDGIKATFVGGSMDYDIAVLKVEGSQYIKNGKVTEATFGDSEKVALGEETFVIGNPAGAGIAVTNGILSVASEYIAMAALDNRDLDKDGQVDGVSYRVMRTSAAINSGNSGGGMFNSKGELIGIVNAKSAVSTVDNMGYALPASQVKAVYENVLDSADGAVRQAMLGIVVSLQASKAVLDEEGNVSVVEEFCVSTPASEGAAGHEKFSAGDVFLSAKINDGEWFEFTRKYQLPELLLTVRKGDKVSFKIRNSSGMTSEVEVSFDKDDYFVLYR